MTNEDKDALHTAPAELPEDSELTEDVEQTFRKNFWELREGYIESEKLSAYSNMACVMTQYVLMAQMLEPSKAWTRERIRQFDGSVDVYGAQIQEQQKLRFEILEGITSFEPLRLDALLEKVTSSNKKMKEATISLFQQISEWIPEGRSAANDEVSKILDSLGGSVRPEKNAKALVTGPTLVFGSK